jgi:hypothetical protein
MGMDIYGNWPQSEKGEYFRTSSTALVQMAQYFRTFAPEFVERCQYWDTNDGDGLSAKAARDLCDLFECELDSGRTATYCQQNEVITCWRCDGTGKGQDGTDCGKCSGSGTAKAVFDLEEAKRFLIFLRDCGGFSIF